MSEDLHHPRVLESMEIPTDPDYDWDHEPEGQQFVNPVHLNNKAINLANASNLIARTIVSLNRRQWNLKVELQAAENELSDFEKELLHQRPANTSASKSLKALAGHMWSASVELEISESYKALIDVPKGVKIRLMQCEMEKDNAHEVKNNIRFQGECIQTHLSFVKAERAASGGYA